MTVQIDAHANGTVTADTAVVDVDRLFDEVSTLDADILDAIERRTRLARTLADVTTEVPSSNDAAHSYTDLGSDGSVFVRMLSRLVQLDR